MTLVIFGTVYLIAAILFRLVTRIAAGAHSGALKAISPSMMSPFGGIFALLLVFTAEPVWSNLTQAKRAVAAEASALRDVVILAKSIPDETAGTLRGLIGKYIDQSVKQEWPAMATQTVVQVTHNVCECSASLVSALEYMRAWRPDDYWQRLRQQEIVSALEQVRAARRERILISEGDIGTVRFAALAIIALCLLTLSAIVHSANRRACGIALILCATVIGTALLPLAAYSNPFSGDYSVGPQVLLEVMQSQPQP